MKIKSPVNKVKASFGHRLDVIRQSKSIVGKCLKTLCNFLARGDILRIRCFMVLAPRPFFSLFNPPSTSRIVGGLSLQEVSGCFSRLLAIFLSSILKDVWCHLGIQYSAKEFIMRYVICKVS